MESFMYLAALSSDDKSELIFSAGVAGGIIVLAVFFALTWKSIYGFVMSHTKTKFDDYVLEATAKPLPVFLGTFGIYLTIQRLMRFEHFWDLYWVNLLSDVVFVGLVLSATWLTFKFVNAAFEWYLTEMAHKTETLLDDAFLPVLQKITKVVMLFIGITIILNHFEVNVTTMIAGAGVASLAIALAAKDTISNMISGFIIMLDRPFRVGDMISLSSGEMGTVHEIGLRSTKIRNFDHTLLIIPNSELCKSRITNYMYPDVKFKIRMNLDVAYGTDIKMVKEMLINICKAQPEVMDDPEPMSYFMEFSSSSLKVRVDCWVEEINERFTTMERMRIIIKDKFEEEGIEVPFQTQTIYLVNDNE